MLNTTPAEAAPAPPDLGTLFVFDLSRLDNSLPLPALSLSLGICRQVTPTETQRLQAAMSTAGQYLANEAADRLASGRRGYAVEVDREFVSYGWVSSVAEPLGATGCAFVPPAQDVWLYDFATTPQFRGQGYYPLLLQFILRELQNSARYAWIGTAPGNATSARSIARAGFTKVAHTRYTPPQVAKPSGFEMLPLAGLPEQVLTILPNLFVTCE